MDQHAVMQLFYKIFDPTLPRLAPGNDTATLKALDLLLATDRQGRTLLAKDASAALDIGCGNGAPTIQLAKRLSGTIRAVDNHQPYLDELSRRAMAHGVAEKIRPWRKDMTELEAADGPYDLIWCEGALYNMGFSHGLAVCHDLLRPGGLMATSELTWLQSQVPTDCRNFFAETYPPMTDIAGNRTAIKKSGLKDLGHFILPAEAWWNEFYTPLADRVQSLRIRHATDPDWGEVLDMVDKEIEICRNYGRYYGYVFHMMQRP